MREWENIGGTAAHAGDGSDAFFVVTELVSPLQSQLLEQQVYLANTPADALGEAGLARALRKLRLLERLVAAERAQNPHYAVSRLVDLEEIDQEDTDTGEAEVAGPAEDVGQGRPVGLADRIARLCGLDGPWGDLREERREMAARCGERLAGRWFRRQVLASVLPMLPLIVRGLLRSAALAAVSALAKAAGAAALTWMEGIARWVEEVIRRLAH